VFMDVTKILCDLISRYAQDNSLKISVAMRNGVNDKDYQRELLFYKRHILNNSLVLHPNIHDELSSYQVCMDSQVVISLDSTLSFELFGIGRKVLFCANSSDKFNDIRNVARQLKRVPSEFLLKNLNYVDFSEKIGNLLVVSDKHMAQFESSRKYYMNFLDSYPHQIIKKTIRNKTSKVHHGKDLKV